MNSTAITIEELEIKCALREQQIADLNAKVKWFEEQFRLSQHRKFGASSEKTDSDQWQLFNEAKQENRPSLPEPTMEKITYRHRKKQGLWEEKIKDLPVETIEYRLPPEKQVCSCCGEHLHEMSTEVGFMLC